MGKNFKRDTDPGNNKRSKKKRENMSDQCKYDHLEMMCLEAKEYERLYKWIYGYIPSYGYYSYFKSHGTLEHPAPYIPNPPKEDAKKINKKEDNSKLTPETLKKEYGIDIARYVASDLIP